MKCVILVAGRGTRMKNLTRNIPKPMLAIKGKPILEYKLNTLPKKINEVIFVVGYKKSQIEKYFGNEYNGMKIRYIIQKELNGTGGAVRLVKDLVGDKFMVMMGDDLYHPEDIKDMLKEELAVLAIEAQDPGRAAVIKTDENNNLLEIVEWPHNSESNLINAGLYMLNKNFFNYDLVPISETECGLPQTLAKMSNDYPVKILKARAWHPIGSPEELKKSEKIIEQFL